jgi:hypothetical protein
MKLISKNLEKDSSGSICLVAEEAEDLWVCYLSLFLSLSLSLPLSLSLSY